MAIDIVTRPSDECMTVVMDDEHQRIDGLILTGSVLEAESESGNWIIGELKKQMLEDVEKCSVAVVVTMDTDLVKSSTRVPFKKA